MKRTNFIRNTILIVPSTLILSVVWYLLQQNIQLKATEKFDQNIQNQISYVGKQLDNYSSLLYPIVGFFSNDDYISRVEWDNYINSFDIIERYPAVTSIEFIQKVDSVQVQDYKKYIEKEYKEFQIYNNFEIFPFSQKEVYYPITFISSLDPAVKSIGFDLSSEELRNNAITLAIKSQKPSATGKLTLLSNDNGMIVLMPIFFKSENNTLVLKGFVSIAFRIDTFVDNIVFKDAEIPSKLRLYDVTDKKVKEPIDDFLLFSDDNDVNLNSLLEIKSQIKLEFAQRSLIFEFSMPFDFTKDRQQLVVINGLIIMVFILICINVLKTHKNIRKELRKIPYAM